MAIAGAGSDPQLIDLDRALDRLPSEQRRAVLLVGLEGMDYEEAATKMAVPVGTVRSRPWRARASLRQMMSDERRRRRQRGMDTEGATTHWLQ